LKEIHFVEEIQPRPHLESMELEHLLKRIRIFQIPSKSSKLIFTRVLPKERKKFHMIWEGNKILLDRVLAIESGPAVEWLINAFGLDLSLVSRLGGHSQPRTHRGKERFPGMTITYGLMEKYEDICKADPSRARILVKSKVTELLSDDKGNVTGVRVQDRDGNN
jgi:hypothetical protein